MYFLIYQCLKLLLHALTLLSLSLSLSFYLHNDLPIYLAMHSKVIANENIRETVNFNCDRRRPIHEIAQDFPVVDFDTVPTTDHDLIWEHYENMLGDDTEFLNDRESAEIHVIADRTRDFFEWLLLSKDLEDKDRIAVCCHATVSRCIFNYGQNLDHDNGGKTPTDVEQYLDTRRPEEAIDVPICNYMGEGVDEYMREDFKNCELRSMILAYPARPASEQSQ